MRLEEKNLSNLKHFMVYSTINSNDNPIFYKKMDELLIRKRFSHAKELSLNEHIYKIDMALITEKDIQKITNEFIINSKNKNLFNKRNIYELLKISNLPPQKLHKFFASEKLLNLANALDCVSRETTLISRCFVILRILDNIVIKLDKLNTSKAIFFEKIRTSVINKIIKYDFTIEENEKETTYLCWIDRLLSATINNEITTLDFQNVCDKILKITNIDISLYWKIINSINYLLLQMEFSTDKNLRTYKNKIDKIIEKKYTFMDLSIDELKNITTLTLAKELPVKEDFYYLFDCIKIFSSKSQENKDFSLELCLYIIYHDVKYNIFSYRFIRKYFIEMIFNLISVFDNIKLKNKEILLLLKLFHIDHFYCFYRKDIFNAIVDVLKNINTYEEKITIGNFYKYLDMIDYIMYANNDITNNNIIDYITSTKDNKNKISRRFRLQKFVN